MPRPYISYSEVSLWRSCQQRWKIDFLDGKRFHGNGIHLDFGTAIHAAIESFKRRIHPPPGGIGPLERLLAPDEAVEVFVSALRELNAKNGPRYREKERDVDLGFFLKAGENIIRRFHECDELARAEVVYNEHELFLPIDRTDGAEIKFKGYIDLVIKTKDKRGNVILYIVDFKSCSWGWDRKKREDKELQDQLFLYKHFLCKKFDLDPTNVRTAFVLLKKRPPKGVAPVEFFPVSAGPVSVQRSLNVLNEDITEMRRRESTSDFKKDRSFCTNDFGDICPYVHTSDCPD